MEGNRVYKIMIVNLIFVIFDLWKALRKQKNKKKCINEKCFVAFDFIIKEKLNIIKIILKFIYFYLYIMKKIIK